MNEQLSSGWTALLHACNTGGEEMVELLLERGADPNTHKGGWGFLHGMCTHWSVLYKQLPLDTNNGWVGNLGTHWSVVGTHHL